MKLTKNIQKAIDKASELHFGQTRKGDNNLPYISHPFSVAWILANYAQDENIIIAGLLHDVIEDVKGYAFEDLKNDFGEKIANIVKEVSEDKDPNIETDDKDTWQHRKQQYLDHLINSSQEAMFVCAADKIHNLRSMAEAYREQGDDLWKKFNSPPDKKIWFYEEVYKILKDKLGNEIVKELKSYKKV